MVEKWKVKLASPDPKVRRKAVQALAMSGERENLVVLKAVHENDPDPEIQAYARQAAQHLYATVQSREARQAKGERDWGQVDEGAESGGKDQKLESRKGAGPALKGSEQGERVKPEPEDEPRNGLRESQPADEPESGAGSGKDSDIGDDLREDVVREIEPGDDMLVDRMARPGTETGFTPEDQGRDRGPEQVSSSRGGSAVEDTPAAETPPEVEDEAGQPKDSGAGSGWSPFEAPDSEDSAPEESASKWLPDVEEPPEEKPTPSPSKEDRKAKVSASDRKAADQKVQRAFSLFTNGQTDKALKAFIRALEINPYLTEDPFAGNLAAELTGLPRDQALASLQDRGGRDKLLDSAKERTEKPQRRKQNPLTAALLVIALAALAFVSYRFVQAGDLDRYRIWITQQLGSFNQVSAAGYDYYLMKPRGNPPQGGWPVVVGLHGYGGQGSDMLSLAPQFNQAGVLYIAPTFGQYAPNPGEGPIEPMRQILEDLAQRQEINTGRVVFLGFSQGGTFAYRFSLYYPNWVSGVVTAGAPDLSAGAPTQGNLPYVFTWGELDGLQDMVMPASVYPLVDQGFNVRYYIVPDAGHEVTPYAVDQALQLVGAK